MRRGVDVETAGVGVEDDPVFRSDHPGCAPDPDQGGDSKRFGHDDRVGVFLPRLGDDSQDFFVVEGGHVRRQDLPGHQDSGKFQLQRMAPLAHQVPQKAPADVLHVGGPLSQVRVVHLLEGLGVFGDHLFERVGRAVPAVDFPLQLFEKSPVLKDHQVGVKNRRIVPGKAFGHPLFQEEGLDPGLLKGAFDLLVFLFPADLDLVENVGETVTLVEEVDRPGGHPRIGDGTPDGDFLRPLPGDVPGHEGSAGFFEFPGETARLFLFLADGIEKPGIDHDGGDLKGDGGEGADFLGAELAGFFGLDDDDAQRRFAVEEGDAEEGVKPLLARFLEVAVAGMALGFLNRHYPALLGGEAGEAFADLQSDLAHGPARKTLGGSQPKGGFVLLQKVDGTDLGLHPPGDQGDDVAEGFVQVVGLEYEGADVLEGRDSEALAGSWTHGDVF